jgi:hypothetical protein
MLIYRKPSSLEIIGYSDSDYTGCEEDRKSLLGYILTLVKGAIMWKTQQIIIASLNSCYEATRQAMWLKVCTWFKSGRQYIKTTEAIVQY